MTTESIEQAAQSIRQFIQKQFKVPSDDPDFSDEVHLFDYGYVDSFGAVDLAHFVETQFSIKVTQADLIACPLNTVREIAEFVVKRKGQEA